MPPNTQHSSKQNKLSQAAADTQALLGSARCFQLKGAPASAMERINAVIAQQPWILSALIEKANLLIGMHDWDEAMDVIMQVLQQEPDNIDALHLSGNFYDSMPAIVFSMLAILSSCVAEHATAYSGIMQL